ncbi:hypothetical protein MMC26_005025 [Xylographa opegraphella]|nr:hypothetical protein [Xylographa opegraphella]
MAEAPRKDLSHHELKKPHSLPNDVLKFLSTASNQTLGACLVALCATTYLFLGRLGLLLIGTACGIVLHATWERSADGFDRDTEVMRRGEVGLDVVQRVLNWQDTKQITNSSDGEIPRSGIQVLDFKDLQPATGAALTALVDAIIRDYVRWWYTPILPADDSLPTVCRQTLTGFLLAVSSHLSRKRPADTFLNFLTNGTSIFIVFLSELASAVMDSEAAELEVGEAIDIYLEESPESNLANLMDLKEQEKKFKLIAEDVLKTFLDTKAFECQPVKVFLREVLAGLILEMTLKSCSKADFINGWIVYLLEDGEPELMNAIDAGVGSASTKEVKLASAQKALNENSGNLQSTKMISDEDRSQANASHQRKISKAEDAMEEAMLEAKRLSDLIASADAKTAQIPEIPRLSEASSTRLSGADLVTQALQDTRQEIGAHPCGSLKADSPMSTSFLNSTSEDADSGYTTGASFTPTSSQDDLNGDAPATVSVSGIERPSIRDATGTSITFDQILTPEQLGASSPPSTHGTQPPLTLHNATVSIFDDSLPGEKASNIIRAKPTVDYLLQVEPASSLHTGWMMARKYADFETLHEVLRRISVISGLSSFTQKYPIVPTWRNQTKESLRKAMETYLRDALSDARLAESEGMKRFLEKDQGLGKPSAGAPGKGLLGFPTPAAFDAMGKGMLDVLASAPKGAAGGGKALFDGVTGVFAPKKPPLPTRPANTIRSGSVSSTAIPRIDSTANNNPSSNHARGSRDISRASADMERSPQQITPRRPTTSVHSSHTPDAGFGLSQESLVSNGSHSMRISHDPARHPTTSADQTRMEAPIYLPPLPTEIADDYSSGVDSPRMSMSTHDASMHQSPSSTAPPSFRHPVLNDTDSATEHPELPELPIRRTPAKPRAEDSPLTEQETQVAVELFFAVINELYTLSSAWNFRRTILNAAKTFLLRPGNPQLEAIRVLLQDTIIAANTSDIGLATHLLKLRENALPTEAELKTWPPPLTAQEHEDLRAKARKLLIEKGMPQALTSVMGAGASGEALSRVFDALQVEKVARGLMFGLLLQGVRALTH